MQLTRLELTNFRNYAEQVLEPPSGLNLLVGGNAQGKTALLEALYLLATSRSFRSRNDEELLRWERPAGRVAAEFRRESGRERRLELSWQRQGQRVEREVRLMGQPLKKLGEFLGEVLLALFVPGDLGLVQAGPGERRRFLDLVLCKLYPTYLAGLTRYQRVLKQRNELLRQQGRAAALEPWDLLLSEHGSGLIARRQELCRDLDPWFSELYSELSGERGKVACRYASTAASEPGAFLQAISRRRGEEARMRTTLVGPHRDEVQLRLDERSLRHFGSQGQQRSAVLALRLAEARALTERAGEGAIILLDDCLSELDADRQARLLRRLSSCPQVFLTSAGAVPSGLEATRWRVHAGQVFPA